MLLSVKVAACGVEKYLDQCLSTFANQKYVSKVEVIVVVNYCTDNSLNIAKQYQKEYPDIFRVVEQGRMDYASTYNTSFDMMRGKYYTNLDGDDYFDRKDFDIYLDALENFNSDIIACDYMLFNENTIKKSSIRNSEITPYKEYCFQDVSDKMSFVEMHSLTIKTDLIKANKVKISSGTIGADLEYAVKVQFGAKSIVYLDLFLYHYRQGHESQRTSFDKLIKNETENVRRSLNLLEWINRIQFDSISLKQYLERRIASMVNIVFYTFLLEPRGKDAYKKVKEYDRKVRDLNTDIVKYYSIINKLLVKHTQLFFGVLSVCYKMYKKHKRFIA